MKTIILKSNGLGRYDDVSPFIITDNVLRLKVELPNFNGEFYLVTEVNGAVQKRLLPLDDAITLENLTAGELNAEVKHYLKGALIKSYKVEPLLLKEVDGSLSGMPEIEALNRRICAVERDFKEFKQAVEESKQKQEERARELVKRLEKVETNLLALVRFAFKDNTENPYLQGGTLDKFMEEYGFTLSEEQIKLIKGDKGNE